jgi:hypothetical protein
MSNHFEAIIGFVLEESKNHPVPKRVLLYRALAEICREGAEAESTDLHGLTRTGTDGHGLGAVGAGAVDGAGAGEVFRGIGAGGVCGPVPRSQRSAKATPWTQFSQARCLRHFCQPSMTGGTVETPDRSGRTSMPGGAGHADSAIPSSAQKEQRPVCFHGSRKSRPGSIPPAGDIFRTG